MSVRTLWILNRPAIPLQRFDFSLNRFGGGKTGDWGSSVADLDYQPSALRLLGCIPLFDAHGRIQKNKRSGLNFDPSGCFPGGTAGSASRSRTCVSRTQSAQGINRCGFVPTIILCTLHAGRLPSGASWRKSSCPAVLIYALQR